MMKEPYLEERTSQSSPVVSAPRTNLPRAGKRLAVIQMSPLVPVRCRCQGMHIPMPLSHLHQPTHLDAMVSFIIYLLLDQQNGMRAMGRCVMTEQHSGSNLIKTFCKRHESEIEKNESFDDISALPTLCTASVISCEYGMMV